MVRSSEAVADDDCKMKIVDDHGMKVVDYHGMPAVDDHEKSFIKAPVVWMAGGPELWTVDVHPSPGC